MERGFPTSMVGKSRVLESENLEFCCDFVSINQGKLRMRFPSCSVGIRIIGLL